MVEEAKLHHLKSVVSQHNCAWMIASVTWGETPGPDRAAVAQAASELMDAHDINLTNQAVLQKAEELATQRIGLGDPTSVTGHHRTQPVMIATPPTPPKGTGGGYNPNQNKSKPHEVLVKPSEISELTSTKDGKPVIKDEYKNNITLKQKGRLLTLVWHTEIPWDEMPAEHRKQLIAATHTRPQRPKSFGRRPALLATSTENDTQERKSRQKGAAESDPETVFAATVLSASPARADGKKLSVDSGASIHLTDEEELMHDLEDCNEIITACNGSNVPVKRKGKLSVNVPDQQGNHTKITLTNVFLVPGSGRTLLSVSRMDGAGAQVNFSGGKGSIITKQGIVIPLTLQNGLYSLPVISFPVVESDNAASAQQHAANVCASPDAPQPTREIA